MSFYSFDFYDLASAFGSAAIFVTIMLALAGLFFAVAAYVFPCYTLMTIGRKARQGNDWMAYLPFAQDVYRLRIVGQPMWHLCFFGGCGGLAIALFDLIVYLIAARQGSAALMVIGLLITFGWLVFRFYVTYMFYQKYYKGFGFNPMLALVCFVPGMSLAVMFVLDVLIAYKSDIGWQKQYVAAPAPVPVPSPVFQDAGPVAGQGRITAISGMYDGAVFRMMDNEELAFGRDNITCQVVFDEKYPEISKRHCTIRYNGATDRYVVTDLSKNGTFTLDDRRLQPNVPVALPRGASIYLGSKQNIFRLG